MGASPSGFLIAGEPAGTKRRIRIGFLGATYSHAPGKLGVILASNDFALVGVCEESAAARQDCEKAGAKIVSQEELLARSEVVAVESACATTPGTRYSRSKPASMYIWKNRRR